VAGEAVLVVNADDGGLADSSDDAILRCAAAGVLRSATVVANGPTAARFVERARAAGLALGLHVNLTQGRALAGPCRTLTDDRGLFDRDKRAVWERAAAGRLDPNGVAVEVRAQLDRLGALGAAVDHVDGHNHVHLFPAVQDALPAGIRVRAPERWPPRFPRVFEAWARAARARFATPPAFAGFAFCRTPNRAVFLEEAAAAGVDTEFMVHPGRRPGTPFTDSPCREAEADVLCAPGLAEALRARSLRPGVFGDFGDVGDVVRERP